MMKSLTLLMLVAVAAGVARADEPIPLWPGTAPGEKGDVGEETSKTPEDKITRITNVTRPTIELLRPPADRDTGATVVVCPGGGYNILAWNHEGTKICKWLNDAGVTAVLLKYRVPRRAGLEKHVAPLQDVQRAMGMVRHRAKEWNIDPKRVGVIGFSAGGHLCASLSTNFETRTYPKVDAADDESCRPDFAILMYPFYLTTDEDPTKLAPEIRVTDRTPPTFICMTQDDKIHYAYVYMLALKQANVPAEMHVYATGKHGFGMKPDAGPVTVWPKLAEQWMKNNGWLDKKAN